MWATPVFFPAPLTRVHSIPCLVKQKLHGAGIPLAYRPALHQSAIGAEGVGKLGRRIRRGRRLLIVAASGGHRVVDGQLFAVLVSARSDVRQNVVQRPIQLPLGGGPLLGVHGEHQADGIVAVRVPPRQAVGVADKEKLGIVPGKGHIQGLRLAAAEQLAGERYLHPVLLWGGVLDLLSATVTISSASIPSATAS